MKITLIQKVIKRHSVEISDSFITAINGELDCTEIKDEIFKSVKKNGWDIEDVIVETVIMDPFDY
jgi:hypothetical protein